MDNELVLKNCVKKIRSEKKLSQEELAEKTGTTRQTIIAIEKGTYNPTTKLALLIAMVLDKKVDELFYF